MLTAQVIRTLPRGGRRWGTPAEVRVLVLPSHPEYGTDILLGHEWQTRPHTAALLARIEAAGGRIVVAGRGDLRNTGPRSAMGQALRAADRIRTEAENAAIQAAMAAAAAAVREAFEQR